tara:strand:+ start:111 stop:272 length:162 start_codon:yes stop_codon:yes gene_type:complete
MSLLGKMIGQDTAILVKRDKQLELGGANIATAVLLMRVAETQENAANTPNYTK